MKNRMKKYKSTKKDVEICKKYLMLSVDIERMRNTPLKILDRMSMNEYDGFLYKELFEEKKLK